MTLKSLGAVNLQNIKSIKGKFHYTATEIKSFRVILQSGLLGEDHTVFNMGRKTYTFLSLSNCGKEISVSVDDNNGTKPQKGIITLK